VPWTFAHPALILPLKKVFPKQLYFLGLVVGSIVPDLGYYVGLWSLSSFAHTLKGVLCICLPVGLFVVYILNLIGPHVAILLPDPHRTAFLSFIKIQDQPSVKSFIILVIAIVLGSLSHLLWDSFTHASGAMVISSELLKSEIIEIGTLPIYGYTLMQHLSSLVGVAILFSFYYSWLKKNNLQLFTYDPKDTWRYKLIASQIFSAAIIASPISYFNVQHFSGAKAVSAFIVNFAFVITPIYFILLLVSALYIFFRKNMPKDFS
jgi:hypothetical protein